ncbi:MAG: citrate/2-methylcitrate synthase [Gemmatimonadota bacterium]
MPESSSRPGLAGVVAAETALSHIDGEAGRLWYRGYDIHALAGQGTFAESLYLLWYGELPGRAELSAFEGLLAAERALPEPLVELLRSLPAGTPPMSGLRTAVSVLGQLDPESEDLSHAASLRKASRLVARLPTVIAAIERAAAGLEPLDPDGGLSHAANFLYMLNGKLPGKAEESALDTSLLLYLEHGLNASTFACRVVASTLSDLHSAITAGVGALKGPLHGGANQRAMEMLFEIGEPGNIGPWLDATLAAKRKVMGFGHRVYRTEDPRATHLRRISGELARSTGDDGWHELALRTEEAMRERTGIRCNVDFYCATVYQGLGLPLRLFTPLFAIGRVGGWAAHVMEQYGNNRLIRPRASFTGTLDRPYVRIDGR